MPFEEMFPDQQNAGGCVCVSMPSYLRQQPCVKFIRKQSEKMHSHVRTNRFLQGEIDWQMVQWSSRGQGTYPQNGYVGDPKGSQYIETNLKEADRRIAMDIVNRKPASSDAMFRLVPKEKLHRSKKLKRFYFLTLLNI